MKLFKPAAHSFAAFATVVGFVCSRCSIEHELQIFLNTISIVYICIRSSSWWFACFMTLERSSWAQTYSLYISRYRLLFVLPCAWFIFRVLCCCIVSDEHYMLYIWSFGARIVTIFSSFIHIYKYNELSRMFMDRSGKKSSIQRNDNAAASCRCPLCTMEKMV